MKSSDLDTAHKIYKQIKALTYALENDKIEISNSFKLYYHHRTYNVKAITEAFGADDASVEVLSLKIDNVFNEYLFDLRAQKIKDLENLGIEYVPVTTKTQEIGLGLTVKTIEEAE